MQSINCVHNYSNYCLFSTLKSCLRSHIRNNHELHNDLRQHLSIFTKTHSQTECESFWSKWWQNDQLFKLSRYSKSEPHCTILLPPPNITGSLHLGHALTVSIQDAIFRYNYMKGIPTLWIPGLDHAGIATQIMIEKHLWHNEQKTRHDLTREQFLARVEQWKNERSKQINNQLIKLGACLDFDYEYYTLSQSMSDAVNEAFIKLFNDGYIYRDALMVNWSFYLQSSISDIEVKYEEINARTELSVPGYDDKILFGVMHRFNYPIENSNISLPVDTTRLETIIGDVAVAVHPDDQRYSHLIGKNVINPLSNQKLPIIADTVVKADFGTGVLKVTSGHSTIDFAIAKRHSLPVIDLFDCYGKLKCPEVPYLHGIDRLKAKTIVQSVLQDRNLYCGQTDHNHSIPMCSRSGDIIESRIVEQWFLKCEEKSFFTNYVVNKDCASVLNDSFITNFEKLNEDDKHITIIPPNYRNTWNNWFKKPQDWCISRQILWGHQIPAFNVIVNDNKTDKWVAAKSESDALSKAAELFPSLSISSLKVVRDNDVLDTWFSSALLPLTVSGWPYEPNLKHFPITIMETGFDILFFWVARMVMVSLLLVNKLPFNKVLLHGMVCDADKKKMSKSKGNVIDPNDIIEGISLNALKQKNVDYFNSGILSKAHLERSLKKLNKAFPNGIPVCGADGLRFSLLHFNYKSEVVDFDINYVIKNRHFTNKMHQTVKFCLDAIDERFQFKQISSIEHELSSIDRWILSCLVSTIKTCNNSFSSYDFNVATRELQNFWVKQMCDVYLEYIKPNIYGEHTNDRNNVINVLLTCLFTSLRAIHPFMPFISENLYQHLKFKLNPNGFIYKSICEETYPDISTENYMISFDNDIKNETNAVLAVVTKIRWFKTFCKINNESLLSDILIAVNGHYFYSYKEVITRLTKFDRLQFIPLHDIYKYHKHICFKINEKDDELLNSYNIHVLFNINIDLVCKNLDELGIDRQMVEEKYTHLKTLEFNNMSKNVENSYEMQNI